jgi:Family of unknown function (DUF6519)
MEDSALYEGGGMARVRFEDVVGTSAVPGSTGFAVTHDRDGSLALSAGRIYVAGFACELDERTPLERLLRDPQVPASGRSDLLYLDAWERHLTAVDDPELLDVALGGADTTTRLEVAWNIGVVEDVGSASCSEAACLLPPQPERPDVRRRAGRLPGKREPPLSRRDPRRRSARKRQFQVVA